MVLIYVDEISERLIYTLDFIFEDRKVAYKLTNNLADFYDYKSCKIAYSSYPFEDNSPTLFPADLLFEETVKQPRLAKADWEDTKLISFNDTPDPLASIFYMLSLYDEYINDDTDHHGRHLINNNIAYKYGWYKQLNCERWAISFINYLQRINNIKLTYEQIKFNFTPSFDIDHAYAFLHRSKLRTVLSQTKDFLSQNKINAKLRKSVLAGISKDPYDTFDYIISLNQQNIKPIVFWLLGDYAKYDRNIYYENEHQKNLILKMDKHTLLGLHPSYKSNEHSKILKTEKQRLENIIQKPIKRSRQHFLKLNTPKTYRNYLNTGIEHDYTLGFAQETGFRAGTVRPFYWFDLSKNEKTNLIIHPFSYMDGTYLEYKNMSVENAKADMQKLMKEVKTYGGDFICIWHNETIGDYGKWEGWKSLLEATIEYSKELSKIDSTSKNTI